jgi:hypothetical protein
LSNVRESILHQPAVEAGQHLYIYCVVDAMDLTDGVDDGDGARAGGFGPIGIGAGHPNVFSVAYDGLAALASATPQVKHEVSRGNVLGHQRAMEAAMARGHTVLPVRFNTVAEDADGLPARQRLLDRVLIERKQELTDLLGVMAGRVELGVKGLWTDMQGIFAYIVDADERIAELRQRLLAATRSPTRVRGGSVIAAQVELGRQVQAALKEAKLAAETDLVARLAPLTVDLKRNATFGDSMFANLALLAEKSRQADVLAVLTVQEAAAGGRVRLRAIGPVPPSNFIELVIQWED